MAAIPTIMKGDDSGAITLNVATGRTYTGSTLVIAYQGVTRSFSNLVPGGTISFCFTHAETSSMRLGAFPVLMELVGSSGSRETVANSDARIKVTDCLAEVNAGGSFIVQPGSACVPITDLGDISTAAKVSDLYAKVNEIIRLLAQRSIPLLAIVASFHSYAATALTSSLGDLNPSSVVVTNVEDSISYSTLGAANYYTDAAIQQAGSVTPTIVTNIASSATSNVVTKAYVESLGVSTSGSQTNSLIASGPLEIHADLTARVPSGVYTDQWEPQTATSGSMTYSYVRFDGSFWKCNTTVEGEDPGIEVMSGDFENPNATTLTFPDGTVTHRVPVTRTTRLATTNDLATSSAETLASATALIPTTAAQVGAYPASSGSQLATQVSTIGAHLNAEDARVIVTNYNSATHMPEASVEIKLPDTTWSTVWREMTRWNYLFDTYLPTNYASKVELDEKADRAWGYYDSHTGLYAPDGFTWISSPKIAIAANLAYQRTVTSEGSVWVLESSGLVTETGVLTNGFFRITDDEGNAQFEIVKGNKRTIGADANSVQTLSGFSPTKLQIGYSVQSDAHPTILVTTSLVDPSWKEETAADCPATVSWSGSSGEWVAQVQAKTALAQMFVQATYQSGGETYIRNAAPVSMSNIIINGTNFVIGTATVGGHTVLTLTPAP